MTHPPTGPSIPTGGWDPAQRERRRVAVISIAIVAVAVVASVLIVVLGTGGDGGDPVAASASNSAESSDSTDSAEASTETDTAGASTDHDVANAEGSPEETVEAYIQALQDADVDAAIQGTCGGLYDEASNAKENGLGVSKDFSQLSAQVSKTEDPPFDTPAPGKLVWVDWEDGPDTVDRIFLTMVVDGEWKTCEVGNDDSPPTPTSTEAASGDSG